MDQPDLDEGEHRRALRALARVNRISGCVGILWPAIRELCHLRAGNSNPQPVRLLDIATGGGDLPIRIWHKARSRRVPLEVAGCDVSPLAIEHARALASQQRAEVSFFPLNVLEEPIPDGFDVITCSLFLHHLDEAQALTVLRKMRAAAGQLALVNDLARSRSGWLAACLGAQVLTRSPTVHVDARLSVEGAFTPAEALTLARRAGWDGATVRRKFPFRFLLAWRRP
jgi:2-polyprenyl-3-methyl-5-hydroxy-6-metoxy-1,4-benzoquinol methylase